MSNEQKQLRGILPAPVTPFDEDGSIRYDHFEEQIRFLISSGVNGVFAAGTTAEGAYLTSEERVSLFRIVKDVTTPEHLRCVVVIQPHTTAVMRGIDDVAGEGPDFISAVTPYYLSATQSDIIDHYTRIAEHSPCPVVLYNIPQNTHNPMALETVLELAAHPNIAGIKDSSGNMVQFQKGVLGNAPEDFVWIQGEDLLDAPSMLMGVRCIVTGLSNVWATPYVEMLVAAEAGDISRVLKIQKQINALAGIIPAAGGNVIAAIKAAASALGRVSTTMRLPGMTPGAEQVKAVTEIVRHLGLM